MLNLDQAIAEWRCQMKSGGVKAPEFLNELECHLRDDVENQMAHGLTVEEAFAATIARLGKPAALHNEFNKTNNMNTTLQRMMSILLRPIWTPHLPELHMKHKLLTLAGVPERYGDGPNQFPLAVEPGWATYCRALIISGPAIFIWAAETIFVAPKVKEIWLSGGAAIPRVMKNLLEAMTVSVNFWWVLLAAVVGLFGILEWRFRRWPRYRRAAMGVAAFLINAGVLVSISILGILAIMAASK